MNKRKRDYDSHINSQKWKDFRQSIINERGYKCEKCSDDKSIIHAHHLTYDRFKNELPSDIQLLCIPCHEAVHEKKIAKRKAKKAKARKPRIKNTVERQVMLSHKKISSKLRRGVINPIEAKNLWDGVLAYAKNRNYEVSVTLKLD